MRTDLQAPIADVRALVAMALAEDLTPFGDLTSSLLDPELMATAEFNARSPVFWRAVCACKRPSPPSTLG